MALELMVDNLEGIDESLHGLYVESDNGYKLDVNGVEDVSGLKKALNSERTARKDFEKKLKSLDGVDPAEYAELKEASEKAANKKLEDAGKFDELRQKWAKDLEKTKTDYEAQLTEKDNLLQKHVLENALRSSAIKAGVVAEDVEDVLVLTRKHFKLDSDAKVRVLDDDGTESMSTVDDFYSKTFKELKPKFYQGSKATGGGTAPNGAGGKPNSKTMKRSEFDALAPGYQRKFFAEGGSVIDG